MILEIETTGTLSEHFIDKLLAGVKEMLTTDLNFTSCTCYDTTTSKYKFKIRKVNE